MAGDNARFQKRKPVRVEVKAQVERYIGDRHLWKGIERKLREFREELL